jgi:hypothetical protein
MPTPGKPPWLKTWSRLYARLREDERQAIYRMLRLRLAAQARRRRTGLRARLARLRKTPAPLRLPILHAALSFILLSQLPTRPLSIPTALGLGLAIIVYGFIFVRSWRLGLRLLSAG